MFHRLWGSCRALKEIKRVVSGSIDKICWRLHIEIVSIVVSALLLHERNVVFFELHKKLWKLDLLLNLHMFFEALRADTILRFDYHCRNHP